MTAAEFLRTLARRWSWVLVGLCLTILAALVISDSQATYWTHVKVRLIPPTEAPVNPLSAGSGSLIGLAGLLTVEQNGGPQAFRFSSDSVTVVDAGMHDGDLIRLPNVGGQWVSNFEEPTVDVQIASRDRDAVLPRVKGTMTDLTDHLDELQTSYGVPADLRVTLIPVSLPVVREATGSRLRAMAGTAIVGGGITCGLVLYGDQLLLRRKGRSSVS